MNTSEASFMTKLKVGTFTLIAFVGIGALTIYVNHRPFWYRPCQLIHINVADATGLKTKSAIRSLGLDIGFLQSVRLHETHVTLGICITAPVEILPETKAYIRGEGFLGDQFVELKPVRYSEEEEKDKPAPNPSGRSGVFFPKIMRTFLSVLVSEAQAAPPPPNVRGGVREIPVGAESQNMQKLVNRVDDLVNEMAGLTTNLKTAINPEDLKKTMIQLNKALENASKTLSPEGGLNQTAQRSLAKLEDAIEQLRSVLTRVNKGEGSIGMLLNDPKYAEEIHQAIRSANRLMARVSEVRFNVDIGGEMFTGYEGSRGWFKLGIWPKRDRYYLLGICVDPRGRLTQQTQTTTAGGVVSVVQTNTVESTGILLTAMFGKIYLNRLDLSIGALNSDGAVSVGLNLWKHERESDLQLSFDAYARSGSGIDGRVNLTIRPFMTLYVRGGIESFSQVNGKMPLSIGAGVSFDDEDIKLLFALR